EEKLAAIWQDVLGVEKIGITDNFFELGGNSLNASQIISRIFREFSVKISFDEFFNKSNIKLISDVMAGYDNTAKWLEKGELIGEDGEFEEVLI
ncbi:phosphopantetheine-binding protein, partial [Flavobacterium sp. HJSW_4]|uniref:phosphopantetheine-binding protein n=1 Tax=Flavobacterium sp. HJSW_4 TaxID=3344660 RepID=UPI0035F430E2